jgi:replicative DNA helicase
MSEPIPKYIRKDNNISDLILYSKLPPSACDLEEAILGSLLIDNNCLIDIIDKIHPEIFYKESHKKICEAILNLEKRQSEIDILTVTNELKRTGNLEIIGGDYYIAQLTNRVTSSVHIEVHLLIVLQKFIQREVIRICTEATRDAYEDNVDILELLNKVIVDLEKINEKNIKKDLIAINEIVVDILKECERASKSENHLLGLPSGLTELDRKTNGFKRKEVIMLAARPSMGKTALALTIAYNLASDFNVCVAFFTLEMSKEALAIRLTSKLSQINSNDLQKGKLYETSFVDLGQKMSKLTNIPLFIDDTAGISLIEVRAKCRKLKRKYDLKLVIIDYLQLMAMVKDKNFNRDQQLGELMRGLKMLANELDVALIVLSQLSRECEKRSDKRPILSDLRESGNIEQDADMVIFIFREGYYDKNFEDVGSTISLTELIIAKYRNGVTGTVRVNFIKEFTDFKDRFDSDIAEYNNNSLGENLDFDD